MRVCDLIWSSEHNEELREEEKTIPGRGSSKCAGLKVRGTSNKARDLAGGTTAWKGLQTGKARSCISQTSKQIRSVLRGHRETYKRLAAGITRSES